jgi:hypothetical protein
MSDDGTLVTRYLTKLKNNRRLAIPIVACIIVVAVATVTESLQKIRNALPWPRSANPEYATAIVYRSRPQASLADELGKASEAWFVWHTGSAQLTSQQWRVPQIKLRVILTHPNSEMIASFARLGDLNSTLIALGVRQFTADAIKAGASVRWYLGPVFNSITIADPESEDGWARIEFALPYQQSALRPSVLVKKRDDPVLFLRLKKTFTDIWDHSLPATSGTP